MKSSKAVKAGLGYTIGNYLIKGLTFLTIPIFSRLLSPTDYGIYNTFAAYEAIGFVLIGMVLHGSYKKAKYEFGEKYQGYVSTTLLLIIINTVIGLLACNIFKDALGELLGLDQMSLNMLILFCFATAIIYCYNAYLGIEYKYKSFVIIAGLNAIGNIGLSILLIVSAFDKQRYMGRIVGTVIPAVLISLYIIYTLWKKRRPERFRANVKWGLGYSLPLVPHGISQVLLTQFDRIMIKKMVGDAQAGIYSFAYNIFTIVSVTTTSLGAVWEPWFFEKMNAKDYVTIKRVSSLYAAGMMVFCALIMLVSPEMIYILGPSEYHEAVYSVVPIVAGGYFAFLYTIPSMVEYFYSKTKFIAVGTVGAAVLNIVLNIYCIKNFGYIAAAYTTLVSYVAYFVFHFILAWKIEGKNLFSMRMMLICGIGIILINALSVAFVDYLFIRWGVAIVLFVVACIVEEKYVGIIRNRFGKQKG